MANLEGLLEKLEPRRLVEFDFDVEAAYKSFPLDEPTVDTYPEFVRLLGRYYGHLTRAVHHCDVDFGSDEVEPRAEDLVERTLGREEAFERASTGRDGGLFSVLMAVGDHFKKTILSRYVEESLRQTVDMEDWEDRAALMKGYLERFAGLLPGNLATTSPEILATRIEEVIKDHVKVQQGLHRLPGQR